MMMCQLWSNQRYSAICERETGSNAYNRESNDMQSCLTEFRLCNVAILAAEIIAVKGLHHWQVLRVLERTFSGIKQYPNI